MPENVSYVVAVIASLFIGYVAFFDYGILPSLIITAISLWSVANVKSARQ